MRWLFRSTPSTDTAAPGPEQAERVRLLRARNARAAELDVRNDIHLMRVQAVGGWTRWAIYCIAIVVVSFTAWAALAELDEVTSAIGKVIPSSREQVVQSLETGVLAELMVAEGQLVEAGQPLLRIDDVRHGAHVQEGRSRLDALALAAARLRAESQGTSPEFPPEVAARNPALLRYERDTFDARRRALESAVAAQQEALRLAQDELRVMEPMAARGLVSELDVMRVQRSAVDIRGRISELRARHRAEAAAELARVQGESATHSATMIGKEDSLRRTVLHAPKRGVVKNIRLTTVGGVVQSGQDLLEIVPTDETLLIETRIRPSDIAFLRPGTPAVVKITAYDSAIYGWLEGRLVQISADTLRDEVRRDETYYRGLVRTEAAALSAPGGKTLPIIPGMVAQVDIKTGRKSVLAYLFKPVLRAREALRER